MKECNNKFLKKIPLTSIWKLKNGSGKTEKTRSRNDRKDEQINIDYVTEITEYIKEVSALIYKSEVDREESLIRQSSNMQTAFSFMSAALFMVASIVIQYKGSLSYYFLLWAFSSIAFLLLVSLVLATVAQRRVKREDFLSIIETKDFLKDNFEEIITKDKRDFQFVNLLGKIQKDLARTNNNRVKLVGWSMRFFYAAVGASLFWFVIALIELKSRIS